MGKKQVGKVSHTVVMTLRDPERNRRIFFLRAWEALILTKALGCAEVFVEACGEGDDEDEVEARRGGSCWGHTSPPLSSESLDSELEGGEYTSLMLDSDSAGAAPA